MQLEDVGPKVASSIHNFFSNEQNVDMLHQLADLGVNMEQPKETLAEGGGLAGKTFLFTGTLTQFKRSEAEAIVESLGGEILGGVSSKLNYLVVGEDAGSKLEKARKIPGIQILTEEDFLKLTDHG
jgi:DNA ligase (NAD+)